MLCPYGHYRIVLQVDQLDAQVSIKVLRETNFTDAKEKESYTIMNTRRTIPLTGVLSFSINTCNTFILDNVDVNVLQNLSRSNLQYS